MSSLLRHLLIGALVAFLCVQFAAAATCNTNQKNSGNPATCSACQATDDPSPGSGNAISPGGDTTTCGCKSFYRKEDTTGSATSKCGICKAGKAHATNLASWDFTDATTLANGGSAAVQAGLCTDCTTGSICTSTTANDEGATAVTCDSLFRLVSTTHPGVTCGACKQGYVWKGADVTATGSFSANPYTTPTVLAANKDEGILACEACTTGTTTKTTGTRGCTGTAACTTLDAGVCSACTAKKEYLKADLSCSSCAAVFREGNDPADDKCGKCLQGYVWAKQSTTPSSGTAGVDACAVCPAGKTTSASGIAATCAATACTDAEIATACSVTCTSGSQYSDSTGVCAECSALNRVGLAPATASCGACTAAYFSSDATGLNKCTSTCASINRADAAGSGCGACTLGFIGSDTGITACASCATVNRVAGAVANTCGACVAGYYENAGVCVACSTLNRLSTSLNGVCGACTSGFVGVSNTSIACVTQAVYNTTCTNLNRLVGTNYPECGACIVGAAGPAATNVSCTVCAGNLYAAAGATACTSCTNAASQQGNGARLGPIPACDSCNSLTGLCTSCPTGSFPLGAGLGCVYRCAANEAPTSNTTVYPCQSCLVNGCTACSNVTGLCTACPAGQSPLSVRFGGCAPDVTGVITVGSSGTIDANTSNTVLSASNDVIITATANVAESIRLGLLTLGQATVLSTNPNAAVAAIVAVIPPGTAAVSVNVTATVNGEVVTFSLVLTPSTDGTAWVASAVVANPALYSAGAVTVNSISVTPTYSTTTITTGNKMRRLAASTSAIPAGATVVLTFKGTVPAGYVVVCGRVIPGDTVYRQYGYAATLVSGNQYSCPVVAPEGSTYALTTAPIASASSSGAAFVPASYTNYHTDVGLGVGLGVGIPVLIAILVTIFCCIGRPAKAVAAPAYGYGVPAPAVTYAAPY